LCASISLRNASRVRAGRKDPCLCSTPLALRAFRSQHLDEGVVAVEQFPSGRRDEDSLLHLLEQQPVAFFRAATVGRIADDMDGSFLFAARSE